MTLYNFLQRSRNVLLYSLIGYFISLVIYLNSTIHYENIFLSVGLLFLFLGGILTIIRGSNSAKDNSEIEEVNKKTLLKKFSNTCLDIYYYSYELILGGFILILSSL